MTPDTEEKLLQDVGFIKAQTAAQTITLELHGNSLDEIVHTLNGNGMPGLKATVADHERALANLRKAAWIIGTPVMTAVGTGLIAALIWIIKNS
jgi:hypothetical protein